MYPNDILTTPTEDLTQADIKSGKIQTLIEDMIDTCLSRDGLGLDANQVGVGKSLLVYRRPGATYFGVLINPICIKKPSMWGSYSPLTTLFNLWH